MAQNEEEMPLVRIIVISVVVAAVLAGGWWLYKQSTYTKYFNASEGMQINYPKDWKMVQSPMPQAVVSFVSPKENALDTFQENVSITTTDLSSNPLSLEDYVLVTEDQMTGVFKDVKIDYSEPEVVGGKPGHKFVFSIVGERPMKLVVYVFLEGTTAYNVTYMGMEDRFEKDSPIINDMMRSFKVFF